MSSSSSCITLPGDIFPTFRNQSKKAATWEIKTEGILDFDKTIHDSKYQSVYNPQTPQTIRFRQESQNGIEPQIKKKKKIVSNARIVQWSDSTWQLAIGDKMYNLQDTSFKNNHIFTSLECQVKDINSILNKDDKDQDEQQKQQSVKKRNFLLYKSPLARRMIPSLQNYQDVIQQSKILRQSSGKKLILTQNLQEADQNSGVLKFDNIRPDDNEQSKSNTLQRIQELQRSFRFGVPPQGGQDQYDDFIDDGEDEYQHPFVGYGQEYNLSGSDEDYDQNNNDEAGEDDDGDDDSDFSKQEDTKKVINDDDQAKDQQEENQPSALEESKQKSKDNQQEEDQDVDQENQNDEQEGDEDDDDDEQDASGEESQQQQQEPVRRSLRRSTRLRGEPQKQQMFQSLDSDLQRQINQNGSNYESQQDEDEQKEEQGKEQESEVENPSVKFPQSQNQREQGGEQASDKEATNQQNQPSHDKQ